MGALAERTPYEFSCDCGARVRVDPMTKERRIPCPRCRKPLEFSVDFDLRQHTLRVSAILPRGLAKPGEDAPAAAPAEPAAAPPRKTAGRTIRGVVAQCPCGAAFPVDDRQLDTAQACPACKALFHVVLKTESGGKKRVAILVPQKPIVHRDEIIRTTIYRKAPGADPAPAKPESKKAADAAPEGFDVTRRRGPRIVVPKSPPPPVEPPPPPPAPEIPVGAQAVPCTCGASFIVRKKDLSGERTCSRCNLVVGFQEFRDPQTLAPTIRIKPRPN